MACGLQTGRRAPRQRGRDAWSMAIMTESTIVRAGEALKGRGASCSRWERKPVSNCGRQYGVSLKTKNRATTHTRVLGHSVRSYSLRPHGLQPARLLGPWDSPGKNSGVGCHALVQGIFPTQGLNPHPLCLLPIAHGFFTTKPPGKPQSYHMTQ